MSRSTSNQDWTMHKCQCGHRSCKQFTISVQGSVGFDEDDAKLICAAPQMAVLLQRAVEFASHKTTCCIHHKYKGHICDCGLGELLAGIAAIEKATV